MNIFTIYDIIVYLYMYQQLYILSNCLCKETNKNINNYICYSILYGSPYLPVPLLATIGQPEKQHKGSANRKRESG